MDPVEEEERLRREVATLERKRVEALEAHFDKTAELSKLGGKVQDFIPEEDP